MTEVAPPTIESPEERKRRRASWVGYLQDGRAKLQGGIGLLGLGLTFVCSAVFAADAMFIIGLASAGLVSTVFGGRMALHGNRQMNVAQRGLREFEPPLLPEARVVERDT